MHRVPIGPPVTAAGLVGKRKGSVFLIYLAIVSGLMLSEMYDALPSLPRGRV